MSAGSLKRRRVESSTASFRTIVRGTRFCDVGGVVPGAALRPCRQAENAVDPNAIALHRNDPSGTRIGYLPREVSVRLAPPLDTGDVVVRAVVHDVRATRRGATAVEIDVEVEGPEAEELVQTVKESIQGSFSSRILSENVALLLKDVANRHAHLLTRSETSICATLLELRPASLALLLRLYVRKGIWFRLQAVDYFEGEVKQRAVQELRDRRCVSSSDDESSVKRRIVLTSTLNVSEIKRLLTYVRSRGVTCHIKGNKPALLKELERVVDEDDQWTESLSLLTGVCIRVTEHVRRTLALAEKLYFLNASQDLSSFLLQELDLTKWPKYKQSSHFAVFPDRSTFNDYHAALDLEITIEAAFADGRDADVEALVPKVWAGLNQKLHKMTWFSGSSRATIPNEAVTSGPPIPLFLSRFRAGWSLANAATVAVAHLEKQRRYEEAIEMLRVLLGGNACPSDRGHWWNRLAVDLQHLKKYRTAYDTCTSALADAWLRHGNRVALQRQILKLQKPLKRWRVFPWAAQLNKPPCLVRVEAQSLVSEAEWKSAFEGKDGEAVTVEQLGLEYYREPRHGGWSGIHTENSLWHTFFGILFWDVIFADVDEVFRTPFQSAPLDFGTDAFYYSREGVILQTLEQIRNGRFCQLFEQVWEGHYGEVCAGVQWDLQSRQTYMDMMQCVGGERLAAICQILAEDFRAVSGGLPDLFLWNLQRLDCKLAEVKGPRDRLSDRQRAWITVLTQIGFHVEVFKIENG